VCKQGESIEFVFGNHFDLQVVAHQTGVEGIHLAVKLWLDRFLIARHALRAVASSLEIAAGLFHTRRLRLIA
jgi:hypothetical protein